MTDFLIVEDELLIARFIDDILKGAAYVNNRIVTSVEAALQAIEQKKPELVFTDISLKGTRTGLDLGHLLHKQYQIPFIYITSHSSSDILARAKHTFPNAYIIKPFKKEDLLVAVELALFNSRIKNSEKEMQEGYQIKQGRAVSIIPYVDIRWLKSEENYTAIHKNKDDKHLVRATLSDMHQDFPPDFIRIHKSYVVNKNWITKWTATQVFIGDVELPVGRSYQTLIKEQLISDS